MVVLPVELQDTYSEPIRMPVELAVIVLPEIPFKAMGDEKITAVELAVMFFAPTSMRAFANEPRGVDCG